MKKLSFVIIALCLLAFTSCEMIEGLDEELIYVRLENTSDEKMKNFILNEGDFGTIKSGRKSKYIGLEKLTIQGNHLMAFYESEVDGKIFTNKGQIGWCLTGATFLQPGRYTIKVDIRKVSDEVETLTFELEE